MINNFLFKIEYKITIVITSILLLAIPSSAFAVIGTGIFDAFKKAMQGIEVSVGPMKDWLIDILVIYTIALLLLALFTWMFQWVIGLNLEHLTLDTEMINVGWGFISGIANMALILILIYLAFAIILKIESVEAKKTLPRLIIVALLLNFSKVFIGMAIDITNIFYNTFLPGPDDPPFIWELIRPFIAQGLRAAVTLVASIKLLATSFAVPIVGLASQIAFAVGFGLIALPMMATLAAQIFIFAILILIFFIFTLVFGARVIIIQMLTILSPFAFLCLILPQTRKHFDTWFKHMIGWLMTGVFLLFFLRLGFLLFHIFEVHPEVGPVAIFFPALNIGSWFAFYLFVAIYLLILLVVAKKTMPEAAQGVTSFIEGKAKKAAMEWGIKTGGMLKSATSDKLISKGSRQFSDWGRKHAKKGGLIRTFAGYAVRKSEGVALNFKRERKKEEDEVDKSIKIMDTDELKKQVKYSDNEPVKIKALIELQKKGELGKMLKNEEIILKDIVRVHKSAKARSTDIEKDIEKAFPHLHKEFGITKETNTDEENKKALTKLLGKTMSNPDLFNNMSPETWENKELKPILLKIIKGHHLGKMVEGNPELYEKVKKVIKGKIEDDGTEKFQEDNPSLAASLKSSAAAGAGYGDIGNILKERDRDFKSILKNIKQKQEEIEKTKKEIKRGTTKIENIRDEIYEGMRKGAEVKNFREELIKEEKRQSDLKKEIINLENDLKDLNDSKDQL